MEDLRNSLGRASGYSALALAEDQVTHSVHEERETAMCTQDEVALVCVTRTSNKGQEKTSIPILSM